MTDFAGSPWVDPIGRALVRSTWQGAAVALALWVALRALRRASPQARYLASCLALASMVAVPVLTGGGVREPSATRSASPVVPPAAEDRAGEGVPARVRTEAPWRLRSALPAAVAAWLAGVAVLSARLAGGLVVATRRRARGSFAAPAAWLDRLEAIRGRLGVRRAVRLLESSYLEVPTVIGWLRPAILVPASAWLGLSAAELEAILAHELAHVRRHDPLFNLLQCAAETLLFYHPAARWASRVIRQEREHCCDDLAVAATGDRLTYARALASMEGLRGPVPSLSIAADGGTLLARVARILEPEIKEEEPMRSLMTLALILAALALAPIGLARSAARQPSPSAPTLPAPGPAVAAPGLPRPDRQRPVPARAYADIVTNVDEAPTGRLMFAPDAGPLRLGGDVVVIEKPGTPGSAPSKIEVEADNVVIYVRPDAPKDPGPGRVGLDPPGVPEALEKLRETRADAPKALGQNDTVTVEKIGHEVAPAKVYPLAGPCHVVTVRYKATLEFDEKVRSNGPNPVETTRRRVEVVFINKDHLIRALPPEAGARTVEDELRRHKQELERLVREAQRRREEDARRKKEEAERSAQEAWTRQVVRELDDLIRGDVAALAGADLDRKLDDLSKKIEALKRDRKVRQTQQRELELLDRNMDELERRGPADPKKSAAAPAPGLPRAFDLAFPVAAADRARAAYYSFFVGAFW